MASMVLMVTAKGFGKLVDPADFRQQKRGGKGVTGYKVTEDSGPVAAVEHVKAGMGERVIICTAKGVAILTPVDDIPSRSRSAGGVKLIDVADDDAVVAVQM